MAVIGYIICLVFILVLFYGIIGACQTAIAYNMTTQATNPIPVIWLYSGMFTGSVLMIVTVVFILLDIFSGSEDYL